MKKKAKRNPTDSTLRNVRAANRRLACLEKRMDLAREWCELLNKDIVTLADRLAKLEDRK
jgi:hypothetical protein